MAKYQCRDCEKHVDEPNIFAILRTEKESYWLCYWCIQKRILVFDKAVELATDTAAPYDEICTVLKEWHEQKGK